MAEFHDFYSNLYRAHKGAHPSHTTHSLNAIPIPKLKSSTGRTLEVIKHLKTGSALGPNGFSACYYKTFGSSLYSYLTRFFHFHQLGSKLDSPTNMAYISGIPKPWKDSSEVDNYRLISLINNDLKILIEILANRMSAFIGSYIHKDQVGFTPGRQGPDQIRRAVDVITLLRVNWDGGSHQEGFLLLVNLQKAFDAVEWPYLFDLLDGWGFGPYFMQLLRALYFNPSAQVKLLGHFSDPFSISKRN